TRSATATTSADPFAAGDQFCHRHVGSQMGNKQAMLERVGFNSLEELLDSAVPTSIRLPVNLNLDSALSESEALSKLKGIMSKNQVKKSFIGMGYYEVLLPQVIQRNLLENPGWYTSYTPYQAEISQGRLESLLNFQTMISDMTGLPLAGASLLDESTAAAEAMAMCYTLQGQKKRRFFVDDRCHPQTIALVQTRGEALGLSVEVGSVLGGEGGLDMGGKDFCGVMVQYPDTYGKRVGTVRDWSDFTALAHEQGALVVGCTDLMASVLLKPVGEMGFDIAVGSAQRFGVPMGFGGPHAGFLATTTTYSRKMPGRIIGVSVDTNGKPALRMAMQTREQHIRRDKATSNICTAQALLANIAACYAVYHGPLGLTQIASRIHNMAHLTSEVLTSRGFEVKNKGHFYDTLEVDVGVAGMTGAQVQALASGYGVNVRVIDDRTVGVSFGEAITKDDTLALLRAFGIADGATALDTATASFSGEAAIPPSLARSSPFLTHPVFNTHRSETQMLRYLKHLENKDLSLNWSMISLGSCTMKLNAASEMVPVTWNEVGNMHPFAPEDQTMGYLEMIKDLNKDLAEITGFAAVSTQPNSGAQGEYAGLLCIRAYHASRNESHRNVCLIPVSAHGTNPASAAMNGMKVVVVKSDDAGNIDIADLRMKAEKHADNL
ncbi:glycine cleavage system P-protein-domain-containing protein, partial [Ochromonadaceae sp. CCMP2298]